MSKLSSFSTLVQKIPNYPSVLPIIKKIEPGFGQLKLPFINQLHVDAQCLRRCIFSVQINQSCPRFTGCCIGAALRRRNQHLVLFRSVCGSQKIFNDYAGIGQPRKQLSRRWFNKRWSGRRRLLRLKLWGKQMSNSPSIKPNPADCCGQGCNPCIFDIYEEQLRNYSKGCCDKKPTVNTNCLLPTSFSVFKVADMQKDTGDTNLYTFKFVKRCIDSDQDSEPPNCTLSFGAGQFFVLRGTDKDKDGKIISRPYTVLHNYKDYCCSFDALIKIMRKGTLTTHYVTHLQPGDLTFWRGPYGKFKVNYKLKNILMIAQGTGITPMFDIANDIVHNEKCETCIKLFLACSNFSNIHLRYQLHDMSENWNFTYTVFLGNQKSEFKSKKLHRENIVTSWLSLEHITKYFKCVDPNDGAQVLICGGPKFNKAVLDYLEKNGVKKEIVHIF